MDFVATLPGLKILDNGMAEDKMISLNALELYARTGMFDEIVAPDVYQNATDTISYAKTMEHMKARLPGVRIMAVAQGSDFDQLLKCYTALYHMPWIDTIGIPRAMNAQFGRESRLNFITSISLDQDFNQKPLHCLGAYYDWPEEIKYLKQRSIVRSMDSSMPYVFGMYNLTFDDDIPKGLKRPTGYFDIVPDEEQEAVITANVGRYRRWAQ